MPPPLRRTNDEPEHLGVGILTHEGHSLNWRADVSASLCWMKGGFLAEFD